jgi:hypothetical protein
MRPLLALIAMAVLVSVAQASEWQTIRPGESTQEEVRAQFGQATKVASQKVDGYDTAQWIYEGSQLPHGMTKMTVDFGLLTARGYRADVVRILQFVPKQGIFNRMTVLSGWGEPTAVKTENGVPFMFYQAGLIVTFDKEGWFVTNMVFTPPQKDGPAPK